MKRRYLHIVSGILMFLCMGTIYSWSVFQKPLIIEFTKLGVDVSSTAANMPYMFFLLSYALSMPFAGKLINRFNPKLICLGGSVLVATAWMISSTAGSMQTLAFTYGVLGGTGVGIIYGVPLAVAAKWYPEKKGLAVGLTLLGFGLSPFITAPIANKLIIAFGVFNSFKILGAAFLVILSLLSLTLRFPEESLGNIGDSEWGLSSKDMLKTKEFYGLWATYTIGTIAGLMIIGVSSTYAQEVMGISSTKAALFTSFFAIFNGIGRPIFGALTDKLGTKKAILLSYTSIISASLLSIIFPGSIVIFVISFSAIWMNLGGWLSIAPASTSNIFGPKNYAENYGILFTAYGAGAFLQGIISGGVKEMFGSYQYIFYPLIGICALGIVLAIYTLRTAAHVQTVEE